MRAVVFAGTPELKLACFGVSTGTAQCTVHETELQSLRTLRATPNTLLSITLSSSRARTTGSERYLAVGPSSRCTLGDVQVLVFHLLQVFGYVLLDPFSSEVAFDSDTSALSRLWPGHVAGAAFIVLAASR